MYDSQLVDLLVRIYFPMPGSVNDFLASTVKVPPAVTDVFVAGSPRRVFTSTLSAVPLTSSTFASVENSDADINSRDSSDSKNMASPFLPLPRPAVTNPSRHAPLPTLQVTKSEGVATQP